MAVSDWLIYGGLLGYILVWILYFIITNIFDLSETTKNAFLIYAIVPWGACCTSGTGFVLSAFSI